MKANIIDLDGKTVKSLDLPAFFEESYRPDLIKKAVLSSQSRGYQPKGVTPYSNMMNTSVYIGVRKKNIQNVSINTGRARLPRLKNRRVLLAGKVAGVSQAVGGPKAHPPKITAILIKKINSKERTKAMLSAISATAKKDVVEDRGNLLDSKIMLPIIVENSIEKIDKTSKVIEFLEKLGLSENVEKAKKNKTYRAGKGKMRGRRYKKRKSILFVLGDSKNYKVFSNVEGADVVSANLLSIQDLAPGTHAGRLAIFSVSAISMLAERFSR